MDSTLLREKTVAGKIILPFVGIIRCSDPRYSRESTNFCNERFFGDFAEIINIGGIFNFLHKEDKQEYINDVNMLRKEFNMTKLVIISHEDCKGYKAAPKFKKMTSKQIDEQIQNDLMSIKTKGIGNILPKEVVCYFTYKKDGGQPHIKI